MPQDSKPRYEPGVLPRDSRFQQCGGGRLALRFPQFAKLPSLDGVNESPA
jgi:hypothetical protein